MCIGTQKNVFNQTSPSLFIDAFPNMIPSNPAITITNSTLSLEQLQKTYCTCYYFCHQRTVGVGWYHNIASIQDLFHRALNYHITNTHPIISHTIISPNDVSTHPINSTHPLVPTVAIHYRCSDNYLPNGMGFLPYYIISRYIPVNVSTIYVLAERRNRGLKSDIGMVMHLYV